MNKECPTCERDVFKRGSPVPLEKNDNIGTLHFCSELCRAQYRSEGWENDCLLYCGGEEDLPFNVKLRNVSDIECYWDDETGVVMFRTSPGEAAELHEQMENSRFGKWTPQELRLVFDV